MPSKQAIIDNIEQYSAPELVEYIKNGVVSFNELCEETDGYFSASVRKEVQRLLSNTEEEDWEAAKNENTIDCYMSFLKTYPDSIYADSARDNIRKLNHESENVSQQEKWDSVDKSNVSELREFIANNPDDSHCKEARRLINSIQEEEFLGFDIDALIEKLKSIHTDFNILDPEQQMFNVVKEYLEKKRIDTNDILSILKRDNNFFTPTFLRKMISEGLLTYDNFVEIGIDKRFIRHLAKGEEATRFAIPRKLEKINKISTEIYFWGIPSSGKSCALGAILSVANSGKVAKSMAKDPDCQGYGYMNRLSHLFSSDGTVGVLPERTVVSATYEMAFDLEDENGSVHPITCIDLAGEVMLCMYKSDAGEILTEEQVEALDTVTRILIDNRTVNRKIHFFVLEYGGEDRKYEGLDQTVYLDAALRYIERTKIFKSETDAIYLMLTKVDKTGVKGEEMVNILSEYVEDHYKGFYQGLVKICRESEINGGQVERIPFSLGSVCFQDYCLFNEAPAANVVRKILTRSKGFKIGKLQKGLNIFKK